MHEKGTQFFSSINRSLSVAKYCQVLLLKSSCLERGTQIQENRNQLLSYQVFHLHSEYEFPIVLCTISMHVLWACSTCQIHAGEDTYLWQGHLCVVPTGCVSHQEMPGAKALVPLLPFSYLMRLQRGRGRKRRERKQPRLLVTQGQENVSSRSLSRATSELS